MGTVEIIIVFSALMALIALVTIGIDWIGKPLKHRRFIPRLYRFDDEKLPVDAYGNTDFGSIESPQVAVPSPAYPPVQGAPVPYPPVAYPPVQTPSMHAPALPTNADHANATIPVRSVPPQVAQPEPRPVAQVDRELAKTSSAFSDTVGISTNQADGTTDSAFADHAQIAGRTSGAEPAAAPSRGPWKLGMAIDTAVDGRKPSLAAKAERFWRSTASSAANSHFDSTDIERMRSGKAPRRVNPRTGRNEVMQLTGLRRASTPDQARMRWPDEVVDPWNPS